MKLLSLLAAWIGGLLIGTWADVSLLSLLLFLVAATTLLLLAIVLKQYPWPAFLGIVLLLGLLRVEATEQPSSFDLVAGNSPVSLRGVVSSHPEPRSRGVQFVLSTGALDRGTGFQEWRTKVLVTATPSPELISIREKPYFRYGDTLLLHGQLEEPPTFEDFDYRSYLARQGIPFVLRRAQVKELLDEGGGNPLMRGIFSVRDRMPRALDRSLPHPQAALAQGLLLGRRAQLPQDVTSDFRKTGTSHLLAISGLHVGVVMALLMGFAVWLLGRRRQLYLLLPLAGVWSYALLSGLSPSVERAAIMVSVYLTVVALGRTRSILPALALAAGIMAGLNPSALTDVSFQLSFTAVAGIAFALSPSAPWSSWILDLPPTSKIWWASPLRGLMLAVVVSLAATLATLPLVAFNFHHIPTLGIPATILALPALPLILDSSTLAAIAEMLHPVLGEVAGWGAWVPLWYLTSLVNLFSLVPGSNLSVPAFSGLMVAVYYALFALALLIPGGLRSLSEMRRWAGATVSRVSNGTSTSRRLPGIGGLLVGVGLAFVAGLLWFQVVTSPDGRLHFLVLDVGQGDSVFIVTPKGRQVLIDGGPERLSGLRALGRHMPFWDRSLDVVVLTHPDEDHLGGLPGVLESYRVCTLLESPSESNTAAYNHWRKVVSRRNLNPYSPFGSNK